MSIPFFKIDAKLLFMPIDRMYYSGTVCVFAHVCDIARLVCESAQFTERSLRTAVSHLDTHYVCLNLGHRLIGTMSINETSRAYRLGLSRCGNPYLS